MKVAFWSFESIQRILAASLNMLAGLNIKKGYLGQLLKWFVS